MLSEKRFLKQYERQQDSGLSVNEFCANEGVATSTFYYWYKKTKHLRGKQEFIPLMVNPSQGVAPTGIGSPPPPPVHATGPTSGDTLLEVEYRNGTRLRIKQDLDLAHLRTLVCLLD